jgi:hypothetical protein
MESEFRCNKFQKPSDHETKPINIMPIMIGSNMDVSCKEKYVSGQGQVPTYCEMKLRLPFPMTFSLRINSCPEEAGVSLQQVMPYG